MTASVTRSVLETKGHHRERLLKHNPFDFDTLKTSQGINRKDLKADTHRPSNKEEDKNIDTHQV